MADQGHPVTKEVYDMHISKWLQNQDMYGPGLDYLGGSIGVSRITTGIDGIRRGLEFYGIVATREGYSWTPTLHIT